MSKFAALIMSHGRADRVDTVKSLKRGGYTGDWYIVIDNEDKTADEYYKKFGQDKVIMFDKLAMSQRIDTADLSQDRRAIVYARNACFDIAEGLGLDYFLELDDDYTAFSYRFVQDKKLKGKACKQLNRLFDCMIEFMEVTGALTVAFAQGGDFVGGVGTKRLRDELLRKAMNTFFCKTSNRFEFSGRVNEDVNTYTMLGSRGQLIFTTIKAAINQKTTQQNTGGMTEMYLDSGTYVKSFYTVIFMPSAVKIGVMQSKHKRMHHMVDWNRCVPKIINEKYKKRNSNM